MPNKRLSYTLNENNEFFTELREKVNTYFKEKNIPKYGNASIKVKSILMFLLYSIPFILTLTGVITSVPLVIFLWVLMGIGMAGLGMVLMHDANHKTYSKNLKINTFLGKSIYLLGGFPPTWRFQHNVLHHGFTNIDGHDEDIKTAGYLRFSPNQKHLKIHNVQQWYAWFFYCLMTISWITAKDFRQLKNYSKNPLFSKQNKNKRFLWTDLIVSKLLYYIAFLIIPIILIPVAWYWVVLSFLLMHFVGGFTLTIIFQTAHVMPTSEFPVPNDEGNIENSWAMHQLMTTTDYAPKSRLFTWLVGGLNFQVVHHLFPTISHVHYKNLSDIVKQTAKKYQLPYHVQSSFLQALKSHYIMLKNLGRNVSPA